MAEENSEKEEHKENVITPEEFEDLEEKEGKKKLLGFARKGKGKPAEIKEEKLPEPKGPLDSVVLKVEKLEGRIESLEEVRHAIDERFSRLSEEIGELRSSLLEKDRTFDKVEAGFRKVEEIVEELEPGRLRKDFETTNEEISKNQARIEALGTQLKEMSKSVKDFRELLGKIKDVKNLVNISNEMNNVLAKVEKERRTITKTSGKIETIFSELSKKISEFDSYKDRVDFNADTMHDLMKSLDMLEIKLENVLKKEDLAKFDERARRMETDVRDDVQEIKDIVGMLVSSLKRTNLKEVIEKQGIESVGSINERMSDMHRRLEAVEGFGKGLDGLKNDVESLKKAMGYVKTRMETAGKPVEEKPKEVKEEETRREEEKARRDALSEMIRYVRECMGLGYTTKQIKRELIEKGWPRKTINEIILMEVIRRRKEARSKESSETGKTGMKEMLVSPKP